MAGKRAVRLRNASDVSVFLAKLINQVLRDEVDPQTASKVGYLANILLGALETSDLEARVGELERRLEEQGNVRQFDAAAG